MTLNRVKFTKMHGSGNDFILNASAPVIVPTKGGDLKVEQEEGAYLVGPRKGCMRGEVEIDFN
jgi:diaminopimelate epimerase